MMLPSLLADTSWSTHRVNWRNEPLLGKLTDPELAARLGVKTSSVCRARHRLGIPARRFQPHDIGDTLTKRVNANGCVEFSMRALGLVEGDLVAVSVEAGRVVFTVPGGT